MTEKTVEEKLIDAIWGPKTRDITCDNCPYKDCSRIVSDCIFRKPTRCTACQEPIEDTLIYHGDKEVYHSWCYPYETN